MFDSPWHWAVVVVVGLILFFGWKQLPDMARSLGRSLRVFKTEIKGLSQDDKAREEHEKNEAPKALEPPRAQYAAPEPVSQPVEAPPARPRPAPRPRA